MTSASRAELEEMLIKRYATRDVVVGSDTIDGLVRAMLAEDARMRPRRYRRIGFAAFVAGQVRYIPPWTWVAQLAIVALMCVIAATGQDTDATKLAVGILSALSVLVGVPTVHASKLYGVAELEYSCPHNTLSVIVSRLIVLGCSSALATTLMVCAVAARLDRGALVVALWAAPPFFSSCAGSLFALRKAAPPTAATLCVAWTVVCSAVLISIAHAVPEMYGEGSLVVWAIAAATAFAWLVREVHMMARSVCAGLDAFSPQRAKTYNETRGW